MIIGISGKLGSGKDTVAQMIQYINTKSHWHNHNDFEDIHYYDFQDIFENESGWKIKRFADKLKDIVSLLIGCTRGQLEDREFKEKPLGEEWKVYKLPDDNKLFSSKEKLRKYYNSGPVRPASFIDSYILTPRKLMQLLGTEAGREIIHPNIWVNALFADYNPIGYSIAMRSGIIDKERVFSTHKKADKYISEEIGSPADEDYRPRVVYPNWIIPDVRFKNEAKAIKDRGGILIRVERKTELRFGNLWTDFNNKNEVEEWDKFLKQTGNYENVYHPSETALDDYEDWDYIIENNYDMKTLLKRTQGIYEQCGI